MAREVQEITENPAFSRRAALRTFGGAAALAATGLALAACGGSGGSNQSTGTTTASVNVAKAFNDIKKDEDNHVAFLISAITANGGTPRPAPKFDTTLAVFNPTSQSQFYALSDALENTGTGAYTYAAQFLVSAPAILVAGASIGLVEGRHAGFLNAITGRPLLTDPTPGQNDMNDPTNPVSGGNFSMEVPQPPTVVVARATPFLGGAFSLNGGPPPPDNTFGGASGPTLILAVLNYALLLEYLEKTFYDLNVPKYFPSST